MAVSKSRTPPALVLGDVVHSEDALEGLRQEAAGCRACPLWELGTQTIFGAGAAHAPIMFIGEAPGEHEDKQGVPFVGPAGRLLDQGLAVAGIDRADTYITNVVKHRPWVLQGKRRKNRPPKQSEINACRPWLHGELAILRPEIIVCVGAPAAREILGKDFRLTQQRGQWFSTDAAPHVIATIHPAYVLIQPDETFDYWRDVLFADLTLIGERYRALRDAAA
jgi:DNA polymerase